MKTYYSFVPTPVGDFLVVGTESELQFTAFSSGKQKRPINDSWVRDAAPIASAIEQIQAYFSGERTEFDLSYHAEGTPFQQAVWNLLEQIPFGTTLTYGAIAEKLNRTGGAQAVGAACGSNPLPIVIPCHRVIGTDGSMTGFGGGLPIKHQLLNHEGIPVGEDQLELDLN